MSDPLHPFVLKNEETFAILDSRGEICPDIQHDVGIFHRGTRHVSRLQLLLWDRPPLVLSATERGAVGVLVSHLSNNDDAASGSAAMTIHLERSTVLTATACLQQFCFTSYGDRPVEMPLTLRLDADFRDIFEVRGYARTARGRTVRRGVDGTLELIYRGLDGEDRVTVLRLSDPVEDVGEEHISLQMTLEPRQTRRLFLVLDFHPSSTPLGAEDHFNAAMTATIQRFREARRSAASVVSDNPAFNSWLMRSFSDVHLLASQVEHGLYPYAGVPWFSCPFGRDGLITARQMLMVEPRLARGVLGYLASRQAIVDDPAHDEEPGKILHESRLGEMAALGEVPFSRYYGAVDSTPLFLMLAGDYLCRSDDRDFIAGLLPELQAAMGWIHRAEASSFDGFLRYLRVAENGLRNQGWKDSDDSIHHADGQLAQGSIALCEVQAYAYGARRALASILHRLGRPSEAEGLLEEAAALRHRFHQAFWTPCIDSYALALDGEGQACKVRASNAGHCLLTGIATKEAAAAIARQLMAPTSFNGWGVRTLDEREIRYNPMSYHNGSVWPHDNALIGMGLARYGHRSEAVQILSGLFETASAVPMFQLPELFCGFPRREEEGPTYYPVACSPQAWASASVFGLLEAITGMAIEREHGSHRVQVRLHNPSLPRGLNLLDINGLRLGEEEISLQFHRSDHDVGVLVRGRSPGVDVLIMK
ncbi:MULTISPECIES: glycogen debranching N-terminal domain-containing protein [unclassified Cyanobium]|uniref:amylo-alpha-1,6-glucosidase n=1 Tax=unclassified Cyanobium TaxID=2627006 RepID=UPI0020CF010A|nr:MULTISPECIES: glycogen debranching N-terminal domain-containing protein [unclassified Cyanobium]MCP9833920.1 amylo-alpha-1,6-glucosidase [Cyanobium sp. La Preciosa 7G6]MCP9936684.1 amylo-alpha-1,6-glucosidase [Cyanobium sp. Aljojuca 7A6]